MRARAGQVLVTMLSRMRLGLIAAVVLLLLPGCASPVADPGSDAIPSATGSGTPVIFSTDMAMGLTTGSTNGTDETPSDVDDAWAYALAVAEGGLDIRGVVVTMGNNMAAPEVAVAKQTVAAMDTDVPVVEGASVWLDDASSVSGDDISTDGCVNDGVLFLKEQVEQTPGLIVLAIGPMTDIACLATQFPESVANLGGVVALIGSSPGPLVLDGKSLRDFNYVMDPTALQLLLAETDVDITVIMFSVSSQGAIATSGIEKLAESANPRAAFFGEQSAPFAKFWTEAISPTKPIWDASVVWYQLRPNDLKCEPMGYKLKVGPPLQEQGAVYDYFDKSYDSKRQVTACYDWRSPAAVAEFTQSVWQAVGGEGTPPN